MDDIKEKACIYCGLIKPLSEFSPTTRGPKHKTADGTGKISRCITCVTNQRMQRQSNSVEVYLRDLFTKSKSARIKKFDWGVEQEDIINLWYEQEGKCALSGVYMTHHADRGEKKDFNASIDRIRSNEGYLKGNIQLVCQRVNIIKNDLDHASLYWWIKHIHQHSCD